MAKKVPASVTRGIPKSVRQNLSGKKYNYKTAGRVKAPGAAKQARMKRGVVSGQSRAAGKAGLRGALKLGSAMSSGRGGGSGVGSKG